jgi:Caspase domain
MNSPRYPELHRFFLAMALVLVCQPALADKRVALVLGNAAYQNVTPLANPVNDAAVIAATLKTAGFDVVDSRHDLLRPRRGMCCATSPTSRGMPISR